MLEAIGLTHWSMPVTDLETSEKFYGEFLGLECRGRLGNGRATCFRAGDANFILWETGAVVDPQIAASGVHYAFLVTPEVWDRAVPAIFEQEVPLAGPIVYREKGTFTGREIYLLDPSGNRIELTDPTWKSGMPTPSFEEILAGAAAPST
jgi:catechol 2,3-dioxygenase-like lactoylglutathione lyase family enzyme